jgi:O-antigen ligase
MIDTTTSPVESGRGRSASAAPPSLSDWIALTVLVAAPLPLGSVEPRFVALWCIGLAVSCVLALASPLDRAAARDILLAAGVFLIYLAVAVWQILPAAGGSGHPAWRATAEATGQSLVSYPSADPGRGLRDLGGSFLFVLAFIRFRLMAQQQRRARRILIAMVISGTLVVLIGALNHVASPGTLLWREKIAYLGTFTGTFINRNTASTVFGSTAIAATMLLASRLRRRWVPTRVISDHLWQIGQTLRWLDWALAFAMLASLVACAATGSRAGFILGLCAWLGGITLYLRAVLPAKVLIGAALVALVGLAGVLGGLVEARIATRSLGQDLRFDVYLATLGLIAERPWFGHGLGAFETVFPAQKPASLALDGVFDRTHSSLLELAFEMGLPVTLAIVTLWSWVLMRLGRAALEAPASVVICGLAIGLLGTVHSLVDFSLQIPGYAVLFAAATAAGLGQGGRSAMAGRERRNR